jgi:DsbC/DsbD-like thiol-disulfide interchange protein
MMSPFVRHSIPVASVAALVLAAAAAPTSPRPVPPAGPTAFIAPDQPGDISEVCRTALVADVARVRPGETFHLAFTASLAFQWHTYWINPGDTGVPARIAVRAPEGFVVGEPRYPRPEVITGPEGTTYGYEHEAWIFVPVTAPADLPADGRGLRFEMDAMYLACRELCVIGTTTLAVELAAAADASEAAAAAPIPADPAVMDAMRPWLARLPRPLADVPGGSMDLQIDPAGGRGVVDLMVPAGPGGPEARPVILPAPGPGVRFEAAEIRWEADAWRIRIPLRISVGNALGGPLLVRGLVGLGPDPADASVAFERRIPLPESG